LFVISRQPNTDPTNKLRVNPDALEW
jgi:hypothetical protein